MYGLQAEWRRLVLRMNRGSVPPHACYDDASPRRVKSAGKHVLAAGPPPMLAIY